MYSLYLTIIYLLLFVELVSQLHSKARKTTIMSDAAYAILSQTDRSFTGQFLIDESVLKSQGISDFSHYAVDGMGRGLETDLFVDPSLVSYPITKLMKPVLIPYKSKI